MDGGPGGKGHGQDTTENSEGLQMKIRNLI